MHDVMGLVIIGGMIAMALWGMTDPGWQKWRGTKIPVSILGYVGGLLFLVPLGTLLVLPRASVAVIVSIAMAGWLVVAYAARRDVRRWRRGRDEK
jgi:hypothetical protein